MTTGDDYFSVITARESDRRARSAFCELVLEITKPGATIFDFGAGPGIDAKFYARRGYLVVAYDVDPRMCESFSRYCREEIALKQVVLHGGDYRSFVDSATCVAGTAVDVVTANFAPLNLIDDPHGLFRKFHAITKPKGRVFISVLNPYFVGDMKYRWWWNNAVGFLVRGYFSVPGANGNIYRRSPSNLRCAAAPYFTLKTVTRGLPGKAYSRWPLRCPSLATSQFMFLLFEKS